MQLLHLNIEVCLLIAITIFHHLAVLLDGTCFLVVQNPQGYADVTFLYLSKCLINLDGYIILLGILNLLISLLSVRSFAVRYQNLYHGKAGNFSR